MPIAVPSLTDTTPAHRVSTSDSAGALASYSASALASPFMARALLAGVITTAALVAFMAADSATQAQATAQAGADLTRLMQAMAAIKALLAACAAAAVFWRLGAPAGFEAWMAYAVACGAMAAGPVLIWSMAHPALGALLLHGGLLAAIVLLWRDPAVGARLGEMIAARRAILHARSIETSTRANGTFKQVS